MTSLNLEINSISRSRMPGSIRHPGCVRSEERGHGKAAVWKSIGHVGNAAFEAIRKVIELAQKKEIDATVTGPINKESINLAGHHYSGHTEIYAHFTNTQDYTMMLAHENLRVVTSRRTCP